MTETKENWMSDLTVRSVLLIAPWEGSISSTRQAQVWQKNYPKERRKYFI